MIAVVPARGGSKGLPRKNVRLLAGKPLIVHTLECALAADAITRVIVSTDDDEIASVARTVKGVEVPFMRPAEFARDESGAVEVYRHVFEWLRDNEGIAPQTLVPLLPTAPLRKSADIDGAVALFRARGAEVVLSVVEAKPLAWHQTLDGDGRMSPVPGIENSIDNRQAYTRTVIPNGAVYVLDLPAFLRTHTYFGARSYGYPMPAERSIDIDTEADMRMAEALMMSAA